MRRWRAAVPLVALLAAACGRGTAALDDTVRACEAGDRAACEKAVRVLAEPCDRRERSACRTLATLYRRGRTGRIEKAKAAAALARACEAADWKACNEAGEAYFTLDRRQAETYRRKACDGGSGEGCLYLSGYVRERGGEAAVAESEALYRRGVELNVKACEAGDADACYGAGAALSRDDEDRAAKYYGQAVQQWQVRCDAGTLDACSRLGAAYVGGKGVPFDGERARRLWDRACAGGAEDACAELAHDLDESGSTSSRGRAASLYEKACAGGVERHAPCRGAGFQYYEGDGIPADKAKAARLLDNGCALGDEWCCFKLGTMLVTGDGVPQDRARGGELTRSAEGLEVRVVETKRGKTMVDPGLTAFGIPETSVTPTVAEAGQELVLVTIEVRRTRESAHLPVRRMYLVSADGRLYPNHAAGDNALGDKPLERRSYMFRVPAGAQTKALRFELGTLTLALGN